jgi:hypothetical protein
VLKNNYFIFNGKYYLQIGGTAMGTKVAPSYACSFLGVLEEDLLKDYPFPPDRYWRYIDDIYFEYSHGEEELLKMVNYLNSQHHSIKFTMEYSTESINFLDTTVKIDPTTRELYTTLYTKPTDTQDYLEFSSCHPEHCKLGGPKGQMIRLRRICTRDSDFLENLGKLCDAYRRRNYPDRILQKHVKAVTPLSQDELLEPKIKEDQDPGLLLILEYNPRNPNVMGFILNHWDDLQSSPLLSEVFTTPPRLVHKRCKNLADSLVRANTTYPKPDPPKNQPDWNCLRSMCKNFLTCKKCPRRPDQQRIRCSVTKQTYRLPTKNISCATRNLVYALQCSVCQKQYVGETLRSFRERIAEHEGDIKNQRILKPLGKHFSLPGHQNGYIKTFLLETIQGDPKLSTTTGRRRERERFWIFRLRAPEPLGLNSLYSAKLMKNSS